jgi:hypothetical protein
MGAEGEGVMGLEGSEAGRGGWVWVADVDLRIPRIGTFFCPLSGKTDDAGETVHAPGTRLPATTNLRFRDFLGAYEIVSPQISNPRVAGSSPAGRIELGIQRRSEARRD